ncbi:hypothetical protein LTS18_005784 [Coniosporium uncinatum]|uniref:Uncharacterized protein n=1 Tax=Coniosporium uncinatum TaxID=93489 RepID=A0ACC3DXG6_9PEZI|nr:hypothetical protein LTS18_005784 [Coniosporium uncinatum]
MSTAKPPYLQSSQEWLKQSALLLKARPTTTRITTKYKVLSPKDIEAKITKSRARRNIRSKPADGEAKPDTEATTTPMQPAATLILKTFDDESGVCLKYKTDKAFEVGRLIGSLGILGRSMAALPDKPPEELEVPAAMDTAGGSGTQTPVPEAAKGAAAEGKGQGGGGGGGKKKKKGKK